MGDKDGSVWIKNKPDEKGTYQVYLELGPDDVISLDVDAAYGWAREVLSAVAQAEYDAAVFQQGQALGLPKEESAAVMVMLRNDRADHVPVSAIPGLRLVPGVSHRNHRGFLRLQRHGQPLGQWELDDARHHALMVIEAFEVSILDTAYLRALEHNVGLDPNHARNVVADLINHRDEPPGDGPS